MTRRLLLSALALSALPALAQAQAVGQAQVVSGPYVSLGAGVDILQDQIEKPYGASGPVGRTFSFEPGPAGDIALGFGFGNGLRLEIEGDYASNRLSDVKLSGGLAGRVTGTEPKYGGFVNLAYDFNLGLPFVPFIGAGAGYQAIGLDNVASGRAGATLNGHGSETEGAFAYQGIAGLNYPVLAVPGLSVTAEYRLIGVITPPPYERGIRYSDDPSLDHNGYITLNNNFNHQALIGLRYSFGAPPPPPPASTPQPQAAAPVPPATRTYLVFFDWDRADLSARARQIVAEAAAASTKVPTTRIDVNGYTDLSGSADYNQRLSVRRAESVEAELVRDGVPKDEILIRGFGETDPLVPTEKGVREPQNRRVEIILH